MSKMIIKKGDKKWIRYIKRRINSNKNFLCMVTGPTGSGKSWATLSVCEQLNDDFNVYRVVFKGSELMKLINDKQYEHTKGIAILWDEAGIGLNAKNFMSVANRVLNYLIQTFRHRNFILFFTSPHIDFLDSATRKMFHANIETVKIDKVRKEVIVKAKFLQYNGDLKKYYKRYLKQGSMKVQQWRIPKPSDKLIEDYENKKNLFTSELNKEIQGKLEGLETKDNVDVDKEEVITNPNLLAIIECWKNGVFRAKDISQATGITQPAIGPYITQLSKKGIHAISYIDKEKLLKNIREFRRIDAIAPLPT
jgi:DNA-binding MarR family transcriptional regulator/Fe-S cluster assembly ATPase SufC